MKYSFGDYILDAKQFQLTRNSDEVAIQPRCLDLLLYLVRNRDRVVKRNELLEKVWSGVKVSSAAINQAIRVVRTAIGDRGTSQALIRTVRCRGYQWVAGVRVSGIERVPGALDGISLAAKHSSRSFDHGELLSQFRNHLVHMNPHDPGLATLVTIRAEGG